MALIWQLVIYIQLLYIIDIEDVSPYARIIYGIFVLWFVVRCTSHVKWSRHVSFLKPLTIHRHGIQRKRKYATNVEWVKTGTFLRFYQFKHFNEIFDRNGIWSRKCRILLALNDKIIIWWSPRSFPLSLTEWELTVWLVVWCKLVEFERRANNWFNWNQTTTYPKQHLFTVNFSVFLITPRNTAVPLFPYEFHSKTIINTPYALTGLSLVHSLLLHHSNFG